MSVRREIWVDYIKVLACVLVLTGHLFQSLVKADIIPDNDMYVWFNTTIYYFHVPLFFLCSGYLYQKNSVVTNLKSWIRNVCIKLVVLGIPYFVFSILTWLLKVSFASEINDKADGLMSSLFLHPISPYWYLYVLFILFVLLPTGKGIISLSVIFSVALLLKSVSICKISNVIMDSYLVSLICSYMIWFVLGMLLAYAKIERVRWIWVGLIFGGCFFVLSIWTYKIDNSLIGLGMGLLACASVVLLLIPVKSNKIMDFFSRYTMPIFLMHTLFAAPTRVALIKMGMTNSYVHIIVGLLISVGGPVLATIIFEKLRIGFIIYPNRIIKKRCEKE